MTDKLRENLGKALECELRELLRTKEAPYMDLAEACQSAARAALAAAPQPAPVPADERAAMIEVIVQADDAYDRVQGGTWAGAIADALLARGLRLPGGETMTSAARDVLAERQRQINVEGWTPEDDDRYENGDLANAAACYAVHAAEEGAPTDAAPSAWPWDAKWWKPSTPRRDLVKAGALILAEIERLDRAEGDTP